MSSWNELGKMPQDKPGDRIIAVSPLFNCHSCGREKTASVRTWSIVRRMGHVQEINCWMYTSHFPRNCRVLCPSCLDSYVRDEVSK